MFYLKIHTSIMHIDFKSKTIDYFWIVYYK